MPEYIVQHTTIIHGDAKKKVQTCEPGATITLSEAEAAAKGDNLQPALPPAAPPEPKATD